METNTITPCENPSEKYDLWLATRFSVAASSYDEANAQAVAWLVSRLTASNPAIDPACVVVTHPAQNLHEAAVLALKLLALEEQGGDALRRVEQLRAEVENQAYTPALASHPDCSVV